MFLSAKTQVTTTITATIQITHFSMIHQLLFTSWLTFAFASPAPAPAPVSKLSLIDSILNNPSIPEVTLAELGLSETGHNVKNFGLAKRLINLKLTMYDIALNSGHLGRLIISDTVPTAPGTTIGTHPLDILFVTNSQNPDEQFCFYTSTYMVRLASLANASGGACNSPSKLADTTSTFNVTSNRIKVYLASYSILPRTGIQNSSSGVPGTTVICLEAASISSLTIVARSQADSLLC
ncbi:hypothetical protein FCULG_00012109 [Fusarium culmorum]|uniref:Uncharacterized protein n=1 Tax=Fusarium culmorum TaxID=5516 RepID=A0A2T4GF94_FUSCU|nr:hypothetical protein FCULG_00012109 [Fusarium culmorum]